MRIGVVVFSWLPGISKLARSSLLTHQLPSDNPKPVCLTCYKRLPGLTYRCRYCTWPLCSPYCQDENSPHNRECSLFQMHSPRFNIEDYRATCPSYNAIMVLRLL